jgi:hypothetical protein
VRGIRFKTLSAGAIDGGVCPTDLAVKHLIAGTLADLTDLFLASANAEGERTNDIAIAATDIAIAATTILFT